MDKPLEWVMKNIPYEDRNYRIALYQLRKEEPVDE